MAIDLNELATAIGQLALRFRYRRATKAAWTTSNEVLLDAEEGYETDTGRKKVGDGVTPWTSLPYNGLLSVTAGDSSVIVDDTDPSNLVLYATASGGGGNPIDVPPTSPDPMDDEFEGTFNTSLWSWQNQNTATASTRDGHLVMVGQLTGADIVNAIEQPLPVGDCSFLSKVIVSAPTPPNFAGVHLRESATGNILDVGVFTNAGSVFIVAKGTMAGSYNSVIATFAETPGAGGPPIYWKTEIIGTHILFSISAEGLFWTPFGSYLITTYFTTAPDRIGFSTRTQNLTYPSQLFVEYFRRIA